MSVRIASGRSEAKGRNGYFVVRGWLTEAYHTRPETPVTLQMWSRKRGDADPLVMDLTIEDARALIHDLTVATDLAESGS